MKHEQRYPFFTMSASRQRAILRFGGPTVVLVAVLLLTTGILPGTFAPLRNIIGDNDRDAHARQLVILRAESSAKATARVNNVWVIRADGSDLRRVTNEAEGVFDFAVSPDGNRLIYATGDKGASTALWLMTIDGNNRTRLSSPNDPARYLSPAWSPAGDAILYVRYELATPRSLGVMLPTGSANTLVSDAGKIWAISPTGMVIGRVYGNGDEVGQSPIWSPDASHAALLEVFPQTGKSNLVITDFAGAPLKIPVEITLHMSWSPDGQWLAFDELAPGNKKTSRIMLLRTDGSMRVPLFRDETAWDSTPAWSPDGQTLAFVRHQIVVPNGAVGRPDEVWRATKNGQDAHRLFAGDTFANSDLNWSPDGQLLAATRYSISGSAQRGIWIVNANGTHAHLLLDQAIRSVWLR